MECDERTNDQMAEGWKALRVPYRKLDDRLWQASRIGLQTGEQEQPYPSQGLGGDLPNSRATGDSYSDEWWDPTGSLNAVTIMLTKFRLFLPSVCQKGIGRGHKLRLIIFMYLLVAHRKEFGAADATLIAKKICF